MHYRRQQTCRVTTAVQEAVQDAALEEGQQRLPLVQAEPEGGELPSSVLAAEDAEAEGELPSVASAVGAEPSSSSKDKGGRVRVGWREHAREQCEAALRPAAKNWLQQRKIEHTTLKQSSDKGEKLLICHCKACQKCTLMYAFRLLEPEKDAEDRTRFLYVEKKGECQGQANVSHLKRVLAREYGAQFSPAKALKKMTEAGVPAEHLPAMWQVKNQRPSSTAEHTYSTDCLEQLRKFVSAPPECIRMYGDHVVCSESEICIPFSCPSTHDILQDSGLTSFLLDFTYKTNREGLLLGCIGAVGMLPNDKGLPSVRMIPAFFVLSNAENEQAHTVLLRLFFEHAETWNMKLEDAFLDCRCLQAAMKWCSAEGRKLYLHRCLQHVKTNIREESARRDAVTGQARLKNRELLSVLLDFVQFSATLPSDLQFHTFWSSVMSRMSAASAPTDFNEPRMAAYIRDNILDGTGGFCLKGLRLELGFYEACLQKGV